jgi:hypothetical protein
MKRAVCPKVSLVECGSVLSSRTRRDREHHLLWAGRPGGEYRYGVLGGTRPSGGAGKGDSGLQAMLASNAPRQAFRDHPAPADAATGL